MTSWPDDILDLSSSSLPPSQGASPGSSSPPLLNCSPAPLLPRQRPWLAIHWRCCQTYSRIYRSPDATAYLGHCPKCGKPLRVPIGPAGTNSRFFEAS